MTKVKKMYQNKLGRMNFKMLKQLFDHCSNTTCDKATTGTKLSLRFNLNVFDKAAEVYSGHLIVNCSDDTRTTRCIRPHKGNDGKVYLLGE